MTQYTPDAVLSVFPGVDLLGRAFCLEGYHVYRGPDALWGQRVEAWAAQPGLFEGVIGGPPCQDYSAARRGEPSGEGDRLLEEYARVVTQAWPAWYLMENVPRVPTITIPGYTTQRVHLDARHYGCRQRRLRSFQFGSLDGVTLVFESEQTVGIGTGTIGLAPCCMASEGTRAARRSWSEFCRLQGLPQNFDLPGWSLGAKYRAVGNGVPIPLGRAVAAAIRRRLVTAAARVCVCGCGRRVHGQALHAGPACRKRQQRRRDLRAVTGPAAITPGRSHCDSAGSLLPCSVTAGRD